jgi:hypothetical protein
MRKQRFRKHIIFAILSVACPIIAFSSTLIYQHIVDSDFWNSLSDKEGTTDAAGAMMGFAQAIELIFFTVIGCVVGIIFAVISFLLWRRSKLSSAAPKT